MSTRWVLHDPVASVSYTFERNPRTGTGSPYRVNKTAAMPVARDGIPRATRTLAAPTEWVISGDLRTKTQYDALTNWATVANRVELSDHLGRSFDVLITRFEPEEHRPTARTPWRFTYRLTALVYGELA